jgi:hypothetical protein
MSGDIHNLEYSERMEFLNKLPNSKHIVKAETKIVDNEAELRKAVKWASSQEGSEGAYLKRYEEGFKYELDGKTQANLKFKNTFSIDAKVIDVHKVKDANAFNYLCVIEDGKDNDVPIGRTYNTSIKVEKGDILKVEFVNLNKYRDPKTDKVFFNWWSPHVIMAREDKAKPDNTLTAEKLVKASKGTVEEKKWPTRYADSALSFDWAQPYKPLKLANKQLADDWRLFVAAIANLDTGKDEPYSFKDIYMWATACLKEIAKRVKAGSMKFTISKEKSESYQKLWNSVSKKKHEFSDMVDLGDVGQEEDYMQSPSEDKDWLGMLQFDSRKKNVGIDLRWQVSGSTIAAFTVFVPKGLSRVPENPADAKKILTKEILPLVKETLADPLKKFNCQPKKNIRATKDVFKEIVGYGPGYDRKRYMWTVDSFEVQHGCKKQHFVELFCDGNLVSGRILFVKIPNKASWEKTPEGNFTWMMFKAKTQLPYVLSARAVNKKWIPAYGASALPHNLRSKTPERFQYWKKKDEKMRLECRDELVGEIKEKLLKLNELKKEGKA